MDTPESTPTSALPAAKKLSEEDKLRIENLQLKLQNCNLQEERLKSELDSCQEVTARIKNSIIALRNTIAEKYGVDFSKTRIANDGTLIESSAMGSTEG
jgi:hypothetical protein